MSNQRSNNFYSPITPAKISGVCAWTADRMGWDVTIVRVVTLISFFAMPVGSLLVYFISALLLPAKTQ